MHTILKGTKDEKSLLLYLETCAVDYSGVVNQLRMNDIDRDNLKVWTDNGFVESGRIALDSIKQRGCSTWVKLSPQALDQAHALRKAKALRTWEKKTYLTTEEKRSL